MMENSENFIRVRVDLSDVGSPLVKQAWVSVDRSVHRTIRDFKLSLYPKFKLPEDRNVCLHLQGCLLPDDEAIYLLRDNDLIRVVYENFPSLLDSQCNDFLGFASSSRSAARHITDGSSDISFPSAKKARIHSPVLNMESFHDISDTQNSISESTCLADISTEINADIHSETQRVKKKHKKRKKDLREKSENNSIKNSFHLENGVNNSASGTQGISVPSGSELSYLVVPKEEIQNYKDGKCAYKMTNLKECKVKAIKQSSKNAAQLSKQVNETFDTFGNDADDAAFKKSKCANIVLSTDSIQSNGSISEKILSKNHSISEKYIPTDVKLEKDASLISDGPENCVDIEKQGRKSGRCSNIESQFNAKATVVAQDHVSQQNECEVSEVKNTSSREAFDMLLSSSPHSGRDSTFLGSSHNEPLQKEGDCTQSLGNNCPKKKRRRRRKRKSQNCVLPSDDIITDCSNNPVPSSTQSIGESVSGFIQSVRMEHIGRKHIRFTVSPEHNSSPTVLDSDCFDNSVEKPVSAVVDASQSSQESFKRKTSSPCEELHCDETVVPDTSFHQEELVPYVVQGDSVDEMKNKTNVQEISVEGKKSKSYENFPPLTRFPVVGDLIAFKVLELTDSYCPEVSDYKEGKVVNINNTTDVLEVDLVVGQVILRMGKFENVYPNEKLEPQVIKTVHVQWSNLIEPKLLS